MHRFIGPGVAAEMVKGDSQPRRISILELPLAEARTWWDYVVESEQIFRSAYWRGVELAEYL